LTPLYLLIIHYTNGSKDELPFDKYDAVRDTYQHGISYSGNRVRRVEVEMHSGGTRAIWDAAWTEHSKIRGLND
jgi:hypothetical protein